MHNAPTVGSKVVFYNYTTCRLEEGTITALDVPIQWRAGIGVEINGTLTRPYDDVTLEMSDTEDI